METDFLMTLLDLLVYLQKWKCIISMLLPLLFLQKKYRDVIYVNIISSV